MRDFTVPICAGAGAYSCVTPPNRFVDLIRGIETRNNSSGEIAARSVELLDAAYRSVKSNRPESVGSHRNWYQGDSR